MFRSLKLAGLETSGSGLRLVRAGRRLQRASSDLGSRRTVAKVTPNKSAKKPKHQTAQSAAAPRDRGLLTLASPAERSRLEPERSPKITQTPVGNHVSMDLGNWVLSLTSLPMPPFKVRQRRSKYNSKACANDWDNKY